MSTDDSRTNEIALQVAELRILALESKLEQVRQRDIQRRIALKSIRKATEGRWPLVCKKTIRDLL